MDRELTPDHGSRFSDFQPSLRIGCVQYLNARPLVHGWPGEISFDHPSALCTKLASGDLDVALVSSFEFLRNPIYRIVDGISIASDGPVYSVVVAHLGERTEIREIALDPASESSANLLRCLLAAAGLKPRLLQLSTSAITPERARLLIGDQALHFRQEHKADLYFWDLGAEWKKLINLPFVYALWLIRPEVDDCNTIAEKLRTLRNRNLQNIDSVIDEKTFDRCFCRHYYLDNLRFGFGEREKNGLRTFATLCAEQGLIPEREIVFDLA